MNGHEDAEFLESELTRVLDILHLTSSQKFCQRGVLSMNPSLKPRIAEICGLVREEKKEIRCRKRRNIVVTLVTSLSSHL